MKPYAVFLKSISILKVTICCLLYIASVMSFEAKGYYSSLETGSLLEEGEYKATLETQVLTDEIEGVNFVGRFDTWMTEELNFQGVLGVGEVDTQVGGFIKWVPFPDYENQPAIGFKAGALYARFGNDNELSARLTPFISKTFSSEIGSFTPYAALPAGVRTIDGHSEVPIQLAFGAEFSNQQLPHIDFLIEAGFDVNKAFSYISLAIQLRMNDTEGIMFP